MARYIPGFISLPLNFIVLVSEATKKARRQKWDALLAGCALLGMLYSLFDSTHTAALGTEASCNNIPHITNSPVGNDGHLYNEDYDNLSV